MHEIKLKQGEYIVNEAKFIEAHKATVKRNENNKTFLPYKERLQLYYQIKEKR